VTGPTGRPTESNGLPHLSDAELAGYLDHDLAPDERRRVEAHVDQCAACRGEMVAVSRITHPEPTTVSQRPTRRRWWWMPAAAAAVVVGLALPRLTSNAPSPDAPQRARRVTDTDGRARLTIVSPANDITVKAPVVFTWRAVNADVYRISVLTESGDPVWIMDVGDTTVTLPDSVSLQRGHAYFWHVDAIGNGIAAQTPTYRLQVPRE